MKIKSIEELLVKSFVQTVSSATTFSKRYKKVCRLLDRKPKLTEEQWLRVWRGLYYSVWYSEMTKGCDILAKRIGTHEDIDMLLAGFKALTNDWFGIDAFRLDKYMFLVRIMVNNCLKLQIKQLVDSKDSLKTSDLNKTIDPLSDETQSQSKDDDKEEDKQKSEESDEEIDNKTLQTEDKTQSSSKLTKSNVKLGQQKGSHKKEIEFPVEFKAKIIDNILKTIKSSIGLTLHMTDIFIDELVRVLMEFSPKLKSEQKIGLYLDCLLPFVRLLAVTEDHRVLNSVKRNIFDKFKKEVLISESIDFRKQLLQQLSDGLLAIGGVESIGRKNRDTIYDIINSFKTKISQLNKTNDAKSLKRKKILIGKGRHKKAKYVLTSSSPFVTSIVPIAVI